MMSMGGRGAGGRRIVESVRVLLLDMRSVTVIALLLTILLSLCLHYLRENRELAMGNRRRAGGLEERVVKAPRNQ